MGSHLILFLFYILPQVTFLTSKTYRVYRVFWPLNFLYWRMDGMGWMDGMVGPLFFFGPYLENYYIIFLNCSRSLKYLFLHIFWNIREKKSECSFFQKISSKSGVDFFFDFLNINSQISRKQLDIFFWLFLVPSEEFLRHLLRKNQKK